MTSVEIRSGLIDALRLDLAGPSASLGNPNEILPQAPSRWYLTGFLVPLEAAPSQRTDETETEQLELGAEPGAADEDVLPEKSTARQRLFPSSIGMTVIVPPGGCQLRVTAHWGDYRRGADGREEWARTPRTEFVEIDTRQLTEKPREKELPNSGGLRIAYFARKVGQVGDGSLAADARTVSLFIVNRRDPSPDERKDEAFAFQVRLEAATHDRFLARPDLRSLASDDWDDRVADLQYRDDGEYSVGHNVATNAEIEDGLCRRVCTEWIPRAEVERVEPRKLDVDLSMDALAGLADAADAKAKLGALVREYREWIDAQIAAQIAAIPAAPARRLETGTELVQRMRTAADRMERGIELLSNPECLEAFRIANRAMADAARRRQAVMRGKPAESVKPAWYPFQLAFILMTLAGIADGANPEREIVDLLFFPTGGGKTEAYLGLAAFTLVLRRLRNPGIGSAGVSILMRYTLRLLTLDQLGRAGTLICALELERLKDVEKLGDWPFEIGLWVGRAATPNRMGKKGDNDPESARARTIRFVNDDRKPSPIPVEDCPWCGTKFKPLSFRLLPNSDEPRDLRISCANRECEFGRGTPLPIVAVDEPIYRRLPCFLIATVDKFAALPWTGPVGGLFGRVSRYDANGFYGPCDSPNGSRLPEGRLAPPDLIIQDELHLISGPLGTMAGLYETALDELCRGERDGRSIRPKVVASTATVRRAETQIRALFGRQAVDIFPPPGPNRRDSFFAVTKPSTESNAREYAGVAAQGRSPKVAMLRVYLALLGAAATYPKDEADPYLTLLGYFNSLRELGGARRLIEDEVRNRLAGYGQRVRVGEQTGLFKNRQIGYEPVELTSRINTADVANAKRRLGLSWSEKNAVDVAIATNMISVGLDITRLGLMVVFGQPKTSAEYIQATSRVGRDPDRPGLVVTIMNVHKPRDRSHYERFAAYHRTFYRSVEATSVTPFSPRALDKGLAAALVGLVRQGVTAMTAPRAAMDILSYRSQLDFVVNVLCERAYEHDRSLPQAERDRLRQRVRERAIDLLEVWSGVANDYSREGVGLQYNPSEAGAAKQLLYDFLSPEVKNLMPDNARMKFRANRSLRDVEPNVNLWLKTLDNADLDDEAA